MVKITKNIIYLLVGLLNLLLIVSPHQRFYRVELTQTQPKTKLSSLYPIIQTIFKLAENNIVNLFFNNVAMIEETLKQ